MSTWVLAANDVFEPPGTGDFDLPPIFGGVTKPMLLVIAATVIIAAFMFLSIRRTQLIPSRLQFLGESLYGFMRNNIARDQIGSKEFRPFIPLIVALFTFVLVNNIYGLIPGVQYPSLARIGFPLALSVLVVYPVYHLVGIRKFGLVGYLKNQLVPPGAPKLVYLFLTPIEFVSKFVTNPLTLAIRVFAAMFAGHMLILVFTLAGEHLLLNGAAPVKLVGVLSFIGVIAVTFLEALIMVIQAYIFALLSASYIGSALAEEH